MSPQAAILAEKIAAVDRHLRRVAERLPRSSSELRPMTDTSDAVILHLWQAVQVVIDLAVSTCVRMGLGAPANYGEALRRLADAQIVERRTSRITTRPEPICRWARMRPSRGRSSLPAWVTSWSSPRWAASTIGTSAEQPDRRSHRSLSAARRARSVPLAVPAMVLLRPDCVASTSSSRK